MPRNAQGVYSLPAGNPVIPGTLIETTWANPTMSDIAAALTGSLPRNGSAPMTGPLILSGDATLPLQAIPLQQLNSVVGSTNSYLPAGAVQLFAMGTVPTGWLECNGSAVSRTTYANLFAAIGEVYGAGNGTTTFNLPDLRGQFVRGWDNGKGVDPSRAIGTLQGPANQAHSHTPTISNPAHTHGITDPGHSHGITDPGHTHTYDDNSFASGSNVVSGSGWAQTNSATGSATTGIAVANALTGESVNAAAQLTTVSISTDGTEARPTNVAMVYAIKAFGALQTDGLGSMAFQNADAVAITGGSGAFTTLSCTTAPVLPNDVARLADIGSQLADIFSSDPAVLLVDKTNPTNPILRPQTNIPNGMVKLDSAGYVPSSVLNVTDLTFLGSWNAFPGLLPTGTFATGDYYQIDTAGTLTLNTSGGSVAQPCNVGDQIIYNSATPGWWYSPAAVASSLPASAITFSPVGTISATNTQAAVAEVSGDVTALATVVGNPVQQTSATGAMVVPKGTTAQRPAGPVYGDQRGNTDNTSMEWWNGSAWKPMGDLSIAQANASYLIIKGAVQAVPAVGLNVSIPAAVKRVTVHINLLSVNSSALPGIQLGSSAGVATTGYAGNYCALENAAAPVVGFSADGFWVASSLDTNLVSGKFVFELFDNATNSWNCTFMGISDNATFQTVFGFVSLPAALNQLFITTINGSFFDGGSASVDWEF